MEVYKISNLLKNINKEDIVAKKISKQKARRIKSRPHQDSSWAIQTLLIFFKLIGLATFAHHVVAQKKRTSRVSHAFRYSESGLLYNAVLVSLVTASNYLSIPYRINLKYPNKTNMTVTIEIFQTLLGSLVIDTILLCYCFGQKTLVRLANRLIDVEHELDRLYRLYPSLQRQCVFRTLWIICSVKGSLVIILMISEYFAFQSSPVSWLTDVLPTFYVGWLMIQYFLLVTVIQADITDVNQAIQCLSGISTPNFEPRFFSQNRRIIVSNSTIHQLLQLQNVYSHLCEITQDVSDFYSLPILSSISFTFFSLVYNGYYLISPLMLSDEILEYEVLSDTVLWLVLLIYPILLLSNRITMIIQEMGKTGHAVHSLLNCTLGDEIKLELKHFSLQLLHCKTQFTVSGYFALDNSFFHSMMGAVTTYLVILVQFQMGNSPISCNCAQENSSNIL